MNSHKGPETLDIGLNSIVYRSNEGPRELCVFVHGVLGHATRTWCPFDSLATSSDDFRDSDIVFYGYDSLGASAEAHGSELLESLGILLSHRTYESLRIYAHSLGAVIARRAMQNAARSTQSHLPNDTKLICFAPAHQVTSLADLLKPQLFLPYTIFQALIRLGLLHYPILRDLTGESAFLEGLRSRQVQLTVNGGNPHLNAYRVLHGLQDRVVDQTEWVNDPKGTFIEGDHSSICKPRSTHDPAYAEAVKRGDS